MRMMFTKFLAGPREEFQTSMCGIAGYFLRSRNADFSEVQAMCDEIRHRGPDDEGYRIEGAWAWGCGGSALSTWPRAASRSRTKTELCGWS